MIGEFSVWTMISDQGPDELEVSEKPSFPTGLESSNFWDNDLGNRNLKVDESDANLTIMGNQTGWTREL